MIIWRRSSVPPKGGAVLTLGTFDGVHKGHQALLKKASARARALKVPLIAVAFRKPPRLFFSPAKEPSLLTTPVEKEALFRRFGADRTVLLSFDKKMAKLSARDFFDRYVRRLWKAREIVVGYDFGFGRGREGTTESLTALGREHGIAVHVVPALKRGGEVISSGAVRRDLAEGKLSAAARKLGYAPFVTAKVVRGKGLGRRLGFPTANLAVDADKILPPGVFAVRVTLPDGSVRRGMANVGVRPTVDGGGLRSAEVHLLDFKGTLPGKTLRMEFLRRLRGERRFPSVEALTRQLHRDRAAVLRFLPR
jgi:riboflavin kinase / FMN adenylyltransferase